MNELLAEFLSETNENIEKLERLLPELRRNPSESALINEAFRRMHTIKASCGFAKMTDIEQVANDAEELLIRLRDGDIKNSPDHIAHVSGAISRVKAMISVLSAHASDPKETAFWTRLEMIAADAAARTGKIITFEIKGQDTPVSRAALDVLKTPLAHLIRNAADHGIEASADRRKAGKPETGRIEISASQSGDFIVFLVSDDGSGLAVDKIKARAAQTGLASPAALATMTSSEIHQFIFRPGFSTAGAFAALSGRGVGLDAVKADIEKAGGAIALESSPGRGCIFSIKIPSRP